jgi:hypothetical protein
MRVDSYSPHGYAGCPAQCNDGFVISSTNGLELSKKWSEIFTLVSPKSIDYGKQSRFDAVQKNPEEAVACTDIALKKLKSRRSLFYDPDSSLTKDELRRLLENGVTRDTLGVLSRVDNIEFNMAEFMSQQALSYDIVASGGTSDYGAYPLWRLEHHKRTHVKSVCSYLASLMRPLR